MKKFEMAYLMRAGTSFAEAAGSIMSAIDDCNGLESDGAQAKARLFHIKLAFSQMQRGHNYFNRFMKSIEINKKDLKKIEPNNMDEV